ncbi:hypothetical protein [Mesotoga infera]|uniref:hypothetical protein n=1 Tax=Mesotoga infera TaxID=1236046 RepID=UPI001469FE6F|nr:hypothetical protein [Mesotoga infera]
MRKVVFSAVLVLLCSVILASGLLMPVVKPPMIVTTLGQSPGALMFRLVCLTLPMPEGRGFLGD